MTLIQEQLIVEQFVQYWNNPTSTDYPAFYDEDVVLVSSLINRTLLDSNGRLFGKETVLNYWDAIRKKYPSFKINLLNYYSSNNEIIIHCSMPPLSDKVLGLISLNRSNKIVSMKLSHV